VIANTVVVGTVLDPWCRAWCEGGGNEVEEVAADGRARGGGGAGEELCEPVPFEVDEDAAQREREQVGA
jgi:hypothetical protein